jgi:hypothetical protein
VIVTFHLRGGQTISVPATEWSTKQSTVTGDLTEYSVTYDTRAKVKLLYVRLDAVDAITEEQ